MTAGNTPYRSFHGNGHTVFSWQTGRTLHGVKGNIVYNPHWSSYKTVFRFI